jgi:replicative DNA helicase
MNDDELQQPPHNLEAERAALGATIQSSKALLEVMDLVSPDDFYRPAHGEILRAAIVLESAGQPVDPVTVAAELQRRGELVRIGGAPYLHTLIESVPVAANATYYAELVAETAVRRSLADAATRISQLAYIDHRDASELVERSRLELDQIAQHARRDLALLTGADIATNAIERYKQDAPPSVATGWSDINKALNGGLRPGTLTIIAARPSVGKSMIGLNLPVFVAQQGGGALIVSLEMPEAELTDRIVAALGKVELDKLTECRLTPDDWMRVEDAANELRGLPLRIVDNPRMTLTRIASLARDCQRSDIGLALLVIDYLTLIAPADSRVPRQEQVAAMSRGLKLMAKEIGVPVVALAQVNRGPEQRADKRPTLADLRESGAIEADADAVWFLHHDPDQEHELEVNIAKNRHGRRATISLAWSPYYARATNLSHLSEVS